MDSIFISKHRLFLYFNSAGWGRDVNGEYKAELTQIDLTIRKKEICNKIYRKNFTTSVTFCADRNLLNEVGTCFVDNGAPSLIR